MSVLHDPLLERLLAKLHAESDAQNAAIRDHYDERDRSVGRSPEDQDARTKTFLSNKLYALDRDKAEFCYQLCRAIDARRIVEIGTSYGVSTIYLAAALRDNLGAAGGERVVIGTEHEPEKARAARAHFQGAGLTRFIDLREGDLRETLGRIDGPADFMLVDIWITMARPALELVTPHLRSGAIVISDNTERYRSEYADYLAFLDAHDFRTMTLPFDGGLEMSVRCRH